MLTYYSRVSLTSTSAPTNANFAGCMVLKTILFDYCQEHMIKTGKGRGEGVQSAYTLS